jgi:rubrerythrin
MWEVVMDKQTRSTMHTAIATEAEEMVRFLLYAERAYAEGYLEIGAMFERAARLAAMEHAREEVLLLGEVGSTAQNLCRAIAVETADVQERYPDLARRADAVGEEALAVLLRDLAAEKAKTAEEFRHAYATLRATSVVAASAGA